MADTTKDLDYLRFFYSSEESLLDKDILKNQAWKNYQKNVALLFSVPALFQMLQINCINKPTRLQQFRFFRNLKIVGLLGAGACMFNEKLVLEKKWRYFDRFYPEPTQLQRTLVVEAQIVKDLERRGLMQDQEEKYLDPETQKTYEQMYQLPMQDFPDDVDKNWGKFYETKTRASYS